MNLINHYQLVRCKTGKKTFAWILYEALSMKCKGNYYQLEALNPAYSHDFGEDELEAWETYREQEPMSEKFGWLDFHQVREKIDYDNAYFVSTEINLDEDLDESYIDYEDSDKVIDCVEFFTRKQRSKY